MGTDSEEDLFHERTLKYQHHVENYWESLLHEANTVWATIEQESSCWRNTTQWNGILKDPEQKVLRLLLKEAEQIYINTEIMLNKAIKNTYP